MFSPRDKTTACGMYSLTYFVALFITLSLIVLFLYLSRKASQRTVRRIIVFLAVFSIGTEIVKMVFTGVTYGIEEVEFTPLYFCSMFMYATPMALFPYKKISDTGLAFLFFGGIVGAAAFFCYPSACIPNYPIYHFMCIRTMLYHGSMIYIGLLIVIRGYFKPSPSHFVNYFIIISTVGALAYLLNTYAGMGYDYMYISKPLDIENVKDFYSLCPAIYPFVAILIQATIPFIISYASYRLVLKILRKKRKSDLQEEATLILFSER